MNILEEIQNCPVEWKELGEVALLKRGKTITSKTATDGPYPVISGGQKPAYFNGEFNREGETITIAGSGAYAGFVMYWDEPIFVSDAFSIEPLEGALIPKFLYHYLLEKQEILFSMKKGSGVPHVYPKDVSKILIPIPPLEIQEKIVQKLDKMTEYVTELTSELTSRKKQYSFYRDKLLSFEDVVYQVEWKELWQVTIWDKKFNSVPTYKQLETDKYEYWLAKELSQIVSESGDVKILTTSPSDLWTSEYMASLEFYEKEIIAIPWGGNPVVQYYKGKFITGDNRIARVKNSSELSTKFLYYYLMNNLQIISSFYRGSGIKHPDMSKVLDLKIPILPLEIQEKIVQALDKFDMVCNDLNIGLPKEIELRQKQYEYWREQLLNFNK